MFFFQLFEPSVQAGIIKANDLFGYRKNQVYIRGSSHVPLPASALMDAMGVFFVKMKKEEDPAVRAIAGHHVFTFIHPYMGGNGRLGRFIMNYMLVSGGYPWSVIRVDDRNRYMQTLETASTEGDILPLADFIKEQVERAVLAQEKGGEL